VDLIPPPPLGYLFTHLQLSCESLKNYVALLWVEVGQPRTKVFNLQLSCLFRGTAVRENDSSTAQGETGASVLNHASCMGEGCCQKSARRRVGVNEVG